MEIVVDITPQDGETYRIVCKSRAIAHWERTFKGASLAKLERDGSASDIEAIAWIAAKREGRWEGNLASFQEANDFAILSPLDLFRESELEAAKQKAMDEDRPWTDADEWRFKRWFKKEYGDDASDANADAVSSPYGGGPTPQGR